MKRLFFLFLLVFVAVATWRISERLSADALGMALGVFLGVLAGIPVALLVLASSRRKSDRAQEETYPPGRRSPELLSHGYSLPVQQPPVIVLAGHGYPQMQAQHGQPPMQQRMLQAPSDTAEPLPAERRFKVVGEKEEWLEEW